MKTHFDTNIEPHFQPIVCVDTGRIFAYEVLGRHKTRQGVKSLGPFFHDPEVDQEEKVYIDRIVRRKAFEKVSAHQRQELLFINIQPQWLFPFLNNKETYPTLEFLKESNLNTSMVTIEICEAAFSRKLTTLNELITIYREAGCLVAIDDLGQGFSNLDRIIYLQPDFLKIDASIIRNSFNKELSFIILETLGLLSQKTGVSLVLEGVETREQFQLGLRAGVRYFQGYFFAHPSPCFIRSDSFSGLIKKELSQYHRSEVSCREHLASYCSELNSLMDSLSLEKGVNDITSALINIARSDWQKIYICDYHGYQKSPNYVNLSPGRWEAHEGYLYRNWCWRPYFLPYVLDAAYHKRGVLSSPYNDLETHNKIWTFIYPLDNGLFVFIDCKYSPG